MRLKLLALTLIESIALLGVSSYLAAAAEPKAKIEGPTSVPFGQAFLLTAEGSSSDPAFPIKWEIRDGKKATLVTFDKDGVKGYALYVKSAEPGEYVFRQKVKGLSTYTVDGKEQSVVDTDVEDIRVIVGVPRPPEPPPGPGPVPPGPDPAPIPSTVGNFRVLFLYETSANLTREQLNTLNSTQVRAYLNSHTITDTGVFAYRFWDKDVDAARESPGWQAAYAAAKSDPTPIPKVAIFAGTTFVKAIPLPATEAETLKLLQTYGGN